MTSSPRPPAVRRFVLATALAGAISLTLVVRLTWARGFGDLRLLGLCLVALGIVSAFPIVFDWKGETENVNVEEAFFAVLVMTSPPLSVMAAMLFATVFLNSYHRVAPLKAAFNIGLFSLSSAAALSATRAVAGTLPVGAHWRGIAGVIVGVLTLYGITTVGVRLVVGFSDQVRLREMFDGMSWMEVLIVASSTSLGVLAGLSANAQPLSLLFVFPPLGVIAFVLHQHARALRDRRHLNHLLGTAVTANQAAGVTGVRDVLVEAARQLLHTTDARIQVNPPATDELGSYMQADETALWLVARPRARKGSPRLRAADPGESQSMLDGIAAIGTGALGSAELLDRVRHQAFHDSLTGLPNRLLFEDRVNQALRGREERHVALLFVDLDRFKRINDSLGHRAGDDLLRQVAERIESSLRSCDSAARVGGDEFVALLPDVSTGETDVALEVAERIKTSLRAPFEVEGREVFVTASVGVAMSPADGNDYDTLLRAADRAMYEAKDAGRDTVRRSLPAPRRGSGMALEIDLRHALPQDELWVAYQPQVDLTTRRIVGTEALVRWTHPDRGAMRPDEFLPLAEELGLLSAIDEWVLETACRQTAIWRRDGATALRVAVNVSGGPLRSGTFDRSVEAVLQRTGLPASALEIEVTERVAGAESQTVVDCLTRLQSLGVRVAIDDFGTGYSSLSRLRTLPADVVKIDKSFTREIIDPHSSVPVVTSAIAMAHGLGLDVVAEGIETPAQLAFLTAHGCETGQGYLLGRPTRAEELFPQRRSSSV